MKFIFSRSLSIIYQTQIDVSPDLKNFLDKRFDFIPENDYELLNRLADWIIRISNGKIKNLCEDYKFLNLLLLQEELYFRRHKSYRLSSFKECNELLYSNSEFMEKYMNGLLLSQIFWSNHFRVFEYFENTFLKSLRKKSTILEIGPGHGLFLSSSIKDNNIKNASAWDISESSIKLTKKTLKALGLRANLKKCNVLENLDNIKKYDLIVLSEILEHLEDPKELLKKIYGSINDGCQLFINIPVNSPAPDHIFLFKKSEEIYHMIENCGFKILDKQEFPITNSSLSRAKKMCYTISVAVIVSK